MIHLQSENNRAEQERTNHYNMINYDHYNESLWLEFRRFVGEISALHLLFWDKTLWGRSARVKRFRFIEDSDPRLI